MKRLVLLIAGLVVSSSAMAVEVTISASPEVNAVITGPIAAGDYVITPIAGAINIASGAVSGCDGAGTCRAEGSSSSSKARS